MKKNITLKMTNEKKDVIQVVCAIAGMALGAFLIIMGMCSEPIGIIDSSVNIALGEVLTFVGSLVGIDYSYKKRYDEIMRYKKEE